MSKHDSLRLNRFENRSVQKLQALSVHSKTAVFKITASVRPYVVREQGSQPTGPRTLAKGSTT